MKNNNIVVTITLAIIVLLISCTSSNDNTSSVIDDNQTQASSWTMFIPDRVFISNVFEKDDYFLTVSHSLDKKNSYLMKIDKSGDSFTEQLIKNIYVVDFVEGVNNNLILLGQRTSEETTATLTYMSTNGSISKTIDFPNVQLSYSTQQIIKEDTGVVFGYSVSQKAQIVKVDFEGNVLWQKEFLRELDPILPDNNLLVVGSVESLVKDYDGNIVIFQYISKTGDENTVSYLDRGFAYYKLNSNGELLASNAIYKASSQEYTSYSINQVVTLPDNCFLVEGGYSSGLTEPRLIDYYDNNGDFIKRFYDAALIYSSCPMIYNQSNNSIFLFTDYTAQDGLTLYLKEKDFENNELTQYDYLIGNYVFRSYSHAIICSDGGFLYLNGYTEKLPDEKGLMLLKIDKNGNLALN